MANKIKFKQRLSGRKAGFTLIEVIIDAFVITVVFGAVIGGFLVMLRATDSGKVRTLAGALASEQIEYLRSLPYDSLSTQGGAIIPQGNIPDTQTVTRGGVSFELKTTISFVDDPADGCVYPDNNAYLCTDGETSNTQDLAPVDYKRINVEALRVGTPTVLIKLSSKVAAKAAETQSNTGILLVKVINAQGQPVNNANVTVTNILTSVTVVGLTNLQGYLFVPNLTPDNQNGYHIVTTKEGYSTDSTTSRTSQNPNQIQPDVDINVQQVTAQTLSIDLLSNMTVIISDQAGQPTTGLSLTATSTKLTATNPDTPKNVYTQTATGSSVTFNNIEWDSYAITISGYYIVSTSPYQNVSVNPGTTLNVTMVVTTNPSWPRVTAVSPTSGTSGSSVVIIVDGFNFQPGSTVVLRLAGYPDLIASIVDVDPNQKSITATFVLTGAAAGDWDIIINSDGNTVTQLAGFTIT